MSLRRLFELSCSVRVRRRVSLCSRTLLLAAVALLTFGCRQNAGSQTAPSGMQSGSQVITPIPFGELNGTEAYNASGVVPLGDARFLFCDDHAADALY